MTSTPISRKRRIKSKADFEVTCLMCIGTPNQRAISKSEKSGIRYPVLLAEDEYFIMNDFRSDTSDSRENGKVKREQIKGSLVFIFRRRGL